MNPLWYKLTQEPETKASLTFLLGRVSWVSWWPLELRPEGIMLVLANTNVPTVVTASLSDPFTFYSP